jgi:hypothetical protein
MSRSPEETSTAWCAGLPLVLQRPFTADEQESLRREARHVRLRGLGVVALFLTLVGLFAGVVIRTDPSMEAMQVVLAVWAILLLAAGLPVTLLMARDSFRRGKGLSGDLRSGIVLRFAGPFAPHAVIEDETRQSLRRARLVPDQPLSEWSLELLPISGRVWRVHGQPVRPWIVAQTVEVANTPPFADIAAQWLEPVAQDDGTTLLAGQRELSRAERDELRRYSQRLWRRPLPVAVGLTLWLCMPIAVLIMEGDLHSRSDGARFIWLAAVTAITDYHFISALLLSRKMRADERAGRVIIVRVADAAPPISLPDKTEGIGNQSGDGSEVAEVLPVSHRVWTESGRPAAWRMTRP